MKCNLCEQEIKNYDSNFHHLIIDENHDVNICSDCIKKFGESKRGIMKNKYSLIAIALGILLAIPTLIEGTSVILGKEQAGMIVLFWLVYYNVGMALFSLFVVYAIWKNLSNKLTMTSVVAVGHVLVLFVLVAIYLSSGQVAVKSLLAMTMRSLVWGTIYFFVRKSI